MYTFSKKIAVSCAAVAVGRRPLSTYYNDSLIVLPGRSRTPNVCINTTKLFIKTIFYQKA